MMFMEVIIVLLKLFLRCLKRSKRSRRRMRKRIIKILIVVKKLFKISLVVTAVCLRKNFRNEN